MEAEQDPTETVEYQRMVRWLEKQQLAYLDGTLSEARREKLMELRSWREWLRSISREL